jgi:hypothetical protein
MYEPPSPWFLSIIYQLIRRLPRRRPPYHDGSAAFHGGVVRITQKGLHVRTAIAMVPFHHLPIDTPPWKASAAMEGKRHRSRV